MKNYYEEIKELEEKNKALSGKLDYKELIKAKKSGDMNKYRMLELQQDNIIHQVDKNRKRIEVLEVCNSIEKNNYRYNFLAENIEKINVILNKYRNKRIGEKTYEKMKNEIKNISTDIRYVIIDMEYWNITIGFNVNIEEITLFAKDRNWFQGENEIELINKMEKIEYDNIEKLAQELINEKNDLKQKQVELNKKIREFNNKVSYCNELYIK